MNKARLALTAIVLLGLSLRIYHLDFPSIGYHNMKENEYLSMAEELGRTRDFLSRRVYFYNAFDDDPQMRIYPQLPLVSYQTLASWKILGNNLWGPRLINVAFGLLGIVVIYFIALLLFGDILLSLFCAFLLAVMPLAVFFSRNLQPESPALFFMLLGNLFYLRFITGQKKYNLFWGGVFFCFAWIYKFSYLFGVLPFLICAPFKKILNEKKELWKNIFTPLHPKSPAFQSGDEENIKLGQTRKPRPLGWGVTGFIFFLSYLIIPVVMLWLLLTGQWVFQELGRVKLFDIFSASYWGKYGKVIWWYITGENFTWLFTLLTFLGISVAFIKKGALLKRYIIGWVFTAIPYSMVFSDYINQHSYYQLPFISLVCVASTYAALFISEKAGKLVKINTLVIMMVIMAASFLFIWQPILRLYRKVYLGEDVAGKTLRELTLPGERIFLYTHCQGYGIARYAQRYAGWPADLRGLKEKEDKFKIRYVCIYPAEYLQKLAQESPDIFRYIQNNYHFKEIGLLNGSVLSYLLLEKGAGEDLAESLRRLSGEARLRAVYKTWGKRELFYTLRL